MWSISPFLTSYISLLIFIFFRTTLANNCNCNNRQPDLPWNFNSIPNIPMPNEGNANGFNNLNNNYGALNNLNNGPGGVGEFNSFGGLNNINNNNNNNNGQIQLPHGFILGNRNRCCKNFGRCNCGNNNQQGNKNHGNNFGGFNLGNNNNNQNQNNGVWTETVKFGKGTRGSSFPQSGSEVPITEFGINGGLTSSNGFPPSSEPFQVLNGNGNVNWNNDNLNKHGVIPLTFPNNQNGDSWTSNFASNGQVYGSNFGSQNANNNGFPYTEKWQGKK